MEWWEFIMVAVVYVAVNQAFEWIKRWRERRYQERMNQS